MASEALPIGVFDSGIGGLTVARVIREIMPKEGIVYLGDTANVPYGDKSKKELIKLASQVVKFLLDKDVKVIVAACNTSSSVSLPFVAQDCPVPLLGMIKPGAQDAVRSTRHGRIGVLATQATVKSLAYTREIKSLNPEVEVIEVGCPELVPLVEKGTIDGPQAEKTVGQYLDILRIHKVDTVVLGCTHYPFLRPVISKIWPEVSLVDPAYAVARELKKLLAELGLGRREGEGKVEFWATGDASSFYTVGQTFWGKDIPEVKKAKLGYQNRSNF